MKYAKFGIFFSFRTTSDKAGDSNAQNAVKGYMSFVLISVAGLSCTCDSPPFFQGLILGSASFSSRPFLWIYFLLARPSLRRRVNSIPRILSDPLPSSLLAFFFSLSLVGQHWRKGVKKRTVGPRHR